MDFLLNELSLQGQFDSTDSFLKSLPCTVKCIELIHQNANMPIYKTEDFYKCSITQDMKLCDLKNYQISDELLIRIHITTLNRSFSGTEKMYQLLRWQRL